MTKPTKVDTIVSDGDGTHILIREEEGLALAKTKRWVVLSRSDYNELGRIAWFGRWRKYAFIPKDGCVFEEVCMHELSAFIMEKTKAHKATKT